MEKQLRIRRIRPSITPPKNQILGGAQLEKLAGKFNLVIGC